MNEPHHGTAHREEHWYDLFSRGARDWLRHNEKVREAVRRRLPELLGGADLITGDGHRRVQVPVRLMEHARFQLRRPDSEQGVGQGEAQPGDVLRPAPAPGQGQGRSGSGQGEGEPEFIVEVEVDEIVEWLWEEMALPNIQPRSGAVEDDEYAREGWDRQGIRARLDRRRTLREALKRRAVQPEGPAFTNEDLRFRQLVHRTRPVTQAVVFFALDASSSMVERDRKLAKSFFFWALQGLRRQYAQIETVFIAHTTKAWEFTEDQFFQVTAQGGTVASTALHLVHEIVEARYDPALFNVYLFYASDGENFTEDRAAATAALLKLGQLASFLGYVETSAGTGGPSETTGIFTSLEAHGIPHGTFLLAEEKDVWEAIRAFFQQQAA